MMNGMDEWLLSEEQNGKSQREKQIADVVYNPDVSSAELSHLATLVYSFLKASLEAE